MVAAGKARNTLVGQEQAAVYHANNTRRIQIWSIEQICYGAGRVTIIVTGGEVSKEEPSAQRARNYIQTWNRRCENRSKRTKICRHDSPFVERKYRGEIWHFGVRPVPSGGEWLHFEGVWLELQRSALLDGILHLLAVVIGYTSLYRGSRYPHPASMAEVITSMRENSPYDVFLLSIIFTLKEMLIPMKISCKYLHASLRERESELGTWRERGTMWSLAGAWDERTTRECERKLDAEA